MEQSNYPLSALRGPELVALLRPQLAHVIAAIEQHGVELGMLLEMLLGLIERHDLEASSVWNGEALEPNEQRLRSQLAADHRTMLAFSGPLILLRQFYDRLRQRLEHVDHALACLPAASLLGRDAFERANELFPLEEERAISARVCGLELDDVQVAGGDGERVK